MSQALFSNWWMVALVLLSVCGIYTAVCMFIFNGKQQWIEPSVSVYTIPCRYKKPTAGYYAYDIHDVDGHDVCTPKRDTTIRACIDVLLAGADVACVYSKLTCEQKQELSRQLTILSL